MSEDIKRNENESRIKILSKEDKKKELTKRLKYFASILALMAITSMITIFLFNNLVFKKQMDKVEEVVSIDEGGFFRNSEGQIKKILSDKYSFAIGVALNKDDFFYHDFSKVASGLLINDKGDILVPSRVIPEGTNEAYVRITTSEKGSVFSAKVMGHDELTGLTLVNSPNIGIKAPGMVTQDRVNLADSVSILGSPFGDKDLINMGFARIHASDSEYTVKDASGNDNKVNLILATTGVYNGNDGSMVIDTEGRIIGILSYFLSDKLGLRGNSAIVPSTEINRVMDRIKGNQGARSFSLGVDGKVINYEGLGRDVFYVLSVNNNSTAKKGGILPTDMILEIDKVPVSKEFNKETVLSNKKVGDVISIKVYRNNEEKTLVMKVY